jgi:hypothetical protein
MALATNMGIFFMLGVTVCMLAAFAAFFIYLIRRANQMGTGGRGDEPSQYVLRATGPVLHASEPQFFVSDPASRGTTRC